MYTFLKLSLRHLWHSRLYAIINIIGLTTASTCMLFAVLYWKDERSYDKFHTTNPNLYRITTNITEKDGKLVTMGGTGQVQGPAFKAGVPEVKNYVRILGGEFSADLSFENKSFRVTNLFVDPNFFEVFNFKLIRGSKATVLNEINAVVITESIAKKYFNNIEVVGKLLKINADPSFERLGKPMIITGVVKDPPKNSSIQFDVLFTFKFLQLSFEDNNWLNSYLGTFIELQPGANIASVVKKFNSVHNIHAAKQFGTKEFDIHGYDPKINYGLQRMTDIHLQPLQTMTGNIESGVANGSTPVYSYLFMGIAIFILVMAAINFININIANSFKRAKEIGVRKITGGSRLQIIVQLMNESALLCLIAFCLSILIMNICLPLFNNLSGKQLVFSDAFNLELLGYFLFVFVLIILLTGLYPAYLLSNFKPSQVLYNKQKLSGNNLFGKSLVVLQFSLSVFLLIATIVYYSQMDFIRTKDLGYNPSQIIRTSVYGDRDYNKVVTYLKNELAKEPAISMVSFGSDGMPENLEANQKIHKGQVKNIDENFLAIMGIPLLAGRNLSPAFATDKTEGILVNQAFVKAFALTNPLGERVMINYNYDTAMKTIRGVVKDFHFGSLREPIKPMILYMKETPDGGIWVKFEKANQQQALAALQRVYMKAIPDAIYDYQYLDELNARQYLQEQRWQKVINVSTVLSLIICCLGLFGLAHLSANQRVKEIGIRKVLGASVKELATLLSGDFIKLVLFACVVAFPVAGLVMNNWLNDYAYRIRISGWIFLLAGAAAIMIALITISFQAIKASLANPVKSLRSE
ncbi:MAG: ABC transporter permease [Bacteroidota bacterium]